MWEELVLRQYRLHTIYIALIMHKLEKLLHCFECGKKFCGTYIDPLNGRKTNEAKEHHNNICCKSEVGFKEEEYCCGGHNSHCNKRW